MVAYFVTHWTLRAGQYCNKWNACSFSKFKSFQLNYSHTERESVERTTQNQLYSSVDCILNTMRERERNRANERKWLWTWYSIKHLLKSDESLLCHNFSIYSIIQMIINIGPFLCSQRERDTAVRFGWCYFGKKNMVKVLKWNASNPKPKKVQTESVENANNSMRNEKIELRKKRISQEHDILLRLDSSAMPWIDTALTIFRLFFFFHFAVTVAQISVINDKIHVFHQIL